MAQVMLGSKNDCPGNGLIYYFYSLKKASASSKPGVNDKPVTDEDNIERLSRQWPYYFYSLKKASASSKPTVDDKPATTEDNVEQLSQQWPYYFYSLKQGSASPKPTVDDKLAAAEDKNSVEQLSRQCPYYFYTLKQGSTSPTPAIDNKPAATEDIAERLSRQWPYYFYSLKQGSASSLKSAADEKPAATDNIAERLSRQWPYYFYSLKQRSASTHKSAASAGSSGSHSHMLASGHNRANKMNHSTMFFFEEAVQVGLSLHFYFPPARRAPLGMLPRDVADSIPFSTSALPGVLAWLGVPAGSPQAADMEETLRMCEAPAPTAAMEGRFCATSLEAMVERAMAALRTRDIGPVMSTRPRSGAPWQPYTIRAVRPVVEGAGSRFVACHDVVYPYTVYRCHDTGLARLYMVEMEGSRGGGVRAGSRFVACHDVVYPYTVYRCHDTGLARLYMVEMEGSRGGGVVTEAVICHVDTSQWVSDHISFKLLGTKPGGPPICLTKYGHIVWAKNDDNRRSSA